MTDLIIAKMQAAITAILDAIVAACTSPKPTYTVEGQSFSWDSYLRMLTDGLKQLIDFLIAFQPFELVTVAV